MKKTEIKIYKEILKAEGEWAAKTRESLRKHNILMLNLIGSPGCGKTALLEALLPLLLKKLRCAVLEGDVETARDAERLKDLGIPVSQIITQGTCHLGAQIVNKAVQELPLADLDLIFVENVGNLVCPTEFDIGEAAKLAVLSVTEGEDKPLKYPLLFRKAGAAVLTKIDLLPHLPFDRVKCLEFISQVNGRLPVFEISALKEQGTLTLADWISAFEIG
ncbi:MAG: hydrogenase nickel incorporation protein HypB [Spirochaetales bacterium]|nr:hydrogenase nickel incorporation protein HypB [Spirochaetales bacterium]